MQQDSDLGSGVSVVQNRKTWGYNEDGPFHQLADGEWDNSLSG